eukprot:scaffold68115_cov70-Attheya_sp.AAC.6
MAMVVLLGGSFEGRFRAGIWLDFYDGWRYRGIWDQCMDVSEFGECSLATVRHLLINGALTHSQHCFM